MAKKIGSKKLKLPKKGIMKNKDAIVIKNK
jgi:hypothetical protein